MTTGTTPPPPVISLSDKLMTMHNLTTFVPVILDVDAMNYADWVYYVKQLCSGHDLLDHIFPPSTTSNPPAPDAEWLKLDFIIRSWITSTLSSTLRSRLVVLNPTTAKEAWDHLEAIFKDNKRPRAMALKAELRNLKLGELTIDAYFRKIESIGLVLSGLGSPLSDEDIVTFALEGLPSTYEIMSTIIASQDPFPDVKTVRSLLTTEEMRLKARLQSSFIGPSSGSPSVLLAHTNNRNSSTSLDKVHKPCFLFNKGSCRFGEACKYLHNGVHGKSTLLPRNSVPTGGVSSLTPSDLQSVQLLLSKLGLPNGTNGTSTPPVALHTSTSSLSLAQNPSPYVTPTLPGVQYRGGHIFGPGQWVPQQGSPLFGLGQPVPQQGGHVFGPGQFVQGVSQAGQPLQGVQQFGIGSGHIFGMGQLTGSQQGVQAAGGSQQGAHGSPLGNVPPGFGISDLQDGSGLPGQATLLPNAFNTATLQDPTAGNWNMDTGLPNSTSAPPL